MLVKTCKMVSTHARSLENQSESSTASNDHNVCLQQLNDQIHEQEQQLAILHVQQQLNKLEVQIHGDTLIKPQLTQNITTEPPQNRSVNNMNDDNETPLRLEIKDYY
ncbi:repeat set, removed [Histoplasma ohiense]|nr:repeat set, removed [Histoplasma ohiense (nom. inval.)]